MKTQLMMGVGGFGLFAALTAVAQPEAEWLVQAAAKKGYAALRRDHLADVARLMGAATVELGATAAERGDHSTGWALARRMTAWARALDGDHAHRLLGNLLADRTNANLWDMHPPFQIDGNFGATAGVAEMLLQSHAGYLDLLPALPKAWAKAGAFRGLCARGAFTVSCRWQDGVPVSVRVESKTGTKPDLRFAGQRLQPTSGWDGVFVYDWGR